MVALVTLNQNSKDKLRHLLNNLNLGTAAADFGGTFVAFLDGTPPVLKQRELDTLQRLLNNLNLGTFKLGFGDLMVDLLSSTAKNSAKAVTTVELGRLEDTLNNLNLGLAHIGFGTLLSKAVTALTLIKDDMLARSGTATVTGVSVACAAADGAKNFTVSDKITSAVISGLALALVTPGDSAKFDSAPVLDADGKTVKFDPKTAGAIQVKLTAAGYNDLTVTINIV